MKFVVSASSQTCLVRQTLLTANPSPNQALHCSSSLLYPQRFEAYPSSQTKFLVCTDSLAAAATATLHDGNGSFFFAWREGGSFKNNPAAAAAAAAEGMFLGSFCSFCLWRCDGPFVVFVACRVPTAMMNSSRLAGVYVLAGHRRIDSRGHNPFMTSAKFSCFYTVCPQI